jgi:hypothetical protein
VIPQVIRDNPGHPARLFYGAHMALGDALKVHMRRYHRDMWLSTNPIDWNQPCSCAEADSLRRLIGAAWDCFAAFLNGQEDDKP